MTSRCGFLSEADERPMRDCTYAASLMMAHDAGIALPLGLTPAEREALERSDDRPDETGASLDDIVTGFARRYRVTVRHDHTAPADFTLAPRDSAVVQLLYSALPPHYQRWDTAFASQGLNSRHAVNVRRTDPAGRESSGNYWLRDPLGRPNDAWCGEWISEGALLHAAMPFAAGLISHITMAPLEGDMIDPTSDIPAALCDVLPGGPLLAADKVTVLDASWAGGLDVGLYSRPALTKGWAAIRIDRQGGPGVQLELAWTPNNRITNVHVTNDVQTVTITGQGIKVIGP